MESNIESYLDEQAKTLAFEIFVEMRKKFSQNPKLLQNNEQEVSS